MSRRVTWDARYREWHARLVKVLNVELDRFPVEFLMPSMEGAGVRRSGGYWVPLVPREKHGFGMTVAGAVKESRKCAARQADKRPSLRVVAPSPTAGEGD